MERLAMGQINIPISPGSFLAFPSIFKEFKKLVQAGQVIRDREPLTIGTEKSSALFFSGSRQAKRDLTGNS
jgi:hypothetical protein